MTNYHFWRGNLVRLRTIEQKDVDADAQSVAEVDTEAEMVYSFNEPSIRMHEKLGFVFEGRLRRTVYTNGRHYDTIYFGLTKEEFDLLDPVAELWEDAQYMVRQ